MMDRSNCMMAEYVGGKIYCGYYDIFYMLCEENQNCPEELDDDDDYEEYIEDDEITDFNEF